MASQQNMFSYLDRQKQDFIKAFQNPAAYPVGVQEPRQTTGISPPPSTWVWDKEVDGKKAFIRTVSSIDKEYWVSVATDFDSKYRQAFLAFLGREYGVIRASVPGTLHADHVLNVAFARRYGINYVRLALVWEKYNMSYGGKIEKNLTQADASGKRMYLIDYIILMKVLRIPPPIDYRDYQARRLQIAQRLAAEGADRVELLLQGMDGFFELWKVI